QPMIITLTVQTNHRRTSGGTRHRGVEWRQPCCVIMPPSGEGEPWSTCHALAAILRRVRGSFTVVSASEIGPDGRLELGTGLRAEQTLADLAVAVHHEGDGQTEDAEMGAGPLLGPQTQGIVHALACRKGTDVGRRTGVDGHADNVHPTLLPLVME